MRAPVAAPPFGRRNTTRRLSFAYRLLNRMQGRWLITRTPAFCTRALACKARTAAHYPLPFTVGDVGIADCATTRSLAGPHSWPAEAEPVRKPATSAHRLCRYPRRFPARTGGPDLPGRTELESPARRHGERPFPAVAGGYPAPGRHPAPAEAEGDCPFGRSRMDESVCPDRRAGARRGKLRPPRPTRSAAPTHHTIPVVKEHPTGQ